MGSPARWVTSCYPPGTAVWGPSLLWWGRVACEPERLLVGAIRAAIRAHHFPNRRFQWGCRLASLMQWRLRSFTFYLLGREAGFWGEGAGLLHPLAFAPHCIGAPRRGRRASWVGSFPGKRSRGRWPQRPGRALCAALGPWTPKGKTWIFDTEVPACDRRAFLCLTF